MSCHEMDTVMKKVLLTCAFEYSAKYGNTVEEQKLRIESDWELLFNTFSKFDIYAAFIIVCDKYQLNWKIYDFNRHYLFLNEWKDEIQKELFEEITAWFIGPHTFDD